MAGARRRRWHVRLADALVAQEVRPLAAAGALLGAGLGGLIQGIVVTGLIGVHHLIDGTPAAMRIADGALLAATWLLTVAGIVMTFRVARWREVPWSSRILLGAMLFGWGAINVLEGAIAHQILGLHHVLGGSLATTGDLAFLALAATVAAAGWCLTRGPVRRMNGAVVVVLPVARRA